MLENLYAYGPTQRSGSSPRTLPTNPTSAKAATRAAMTAELLDAHRAGRVAVAIGRASDFFGPGHHGVGARRRGVRRVRSPAAGPRCWAGPDQPHSYSYTPDVAAALVTLGSDDRAAGHVWHLPIAETRPTRQIVEDVYRLAGRQPRLLAARRPALRIIGTVARSTREYLHTLYQFDEPWIVDDGRYRRAFGGRRHVARRRPRHDPRMVPRPDPRSDPSHPPPRSTTMTRHHDPPLRRHWGMIGAAALATAGFTGLGAAFDYPAILDEPTAEILDAYRAHQTAVSLWFAALVARRRAARSDRRPARQARATRQGVAGSPASASPPPPCR